jgi:hypothetical protein
VANDPTVKHLPLGTTLGPSVQDRNCVLELACFSYRLAP